MGRRSVRSEPGAGVRLPRWILLAGALAVIGGAVALVSVRPATREGAGELAPDVTLPTLQGPYRLSEQRGEAVVLYFSFVG